MKKVKIVNGIYGHRPGGVGSATPIPAGESVEVSDDEAARLVGLDVAIIIYDEPAPVATPDVGQSSGGECDDPPHAEDGAEGRTYGDTLDIVNGHFTAESLMDMTVPNLKMLAAELKANVSKCKNKPEIVAVLVTIEIDDEEEGNPPVLGAEAPVT